jgi:hypothetical protein
LTTNRLHISSLKITLSFQNAHSGGSPLLPIASLGHADMRPLCSFTCTTGGGSSMSHNPPPSSVTSPASLLAMYRRSCAGVLYFA